MYRTMRGGHSFYPGARGRGSWRGNQTRDQVSDESRPPPRGNLIESTTMQALQSNPAFESAKPTIGTCEYVASFSWLKNEMPTIVIPGTPPRWAPLNTPEQLQEDSGTYFRDVNAAHYPRHPLEPAVRAVLAQNVDLSLDDIDVFACGSTMGNLLRFARKSDRNFQFIVESIGETVFLVRRENSADEKIPDVRGYGHSFPEAYTKLDECVKKADSHQRMIKYDLAGFHCIIRYEVDGYLPERISPGSREAHVQAQPELEDLKLLSGGKIIPQEAIFDLKTRSSRRQLTLDDVLGDELSRLWVRQIPNFVLAYHTRGVFEDVKVHDVRQRIRTWEEHHQEEIKVFSAALAKIVELARGRPGQRFEVCSGGPGVLEFREVGGDYPDALPRDMAHLWASDARSQDGHDSLHEKSYLGHGSDDESDDSSDSDSGDGKDFTVCSAERCGYCGRCA